MDKLEIKGNWNKIKGKLKEKYGQLTDEDLVYIEGRKEQLPGKLQKATVKSRDVKPQQVEVRIKGPGTGN